MVTLLEADVDEEEFIKAFLNTADMNHVIEKVYLVPVKEYGSEGLMPLEGRCPEYPDTDISCVGRSGDNMCGCFFGQVLDNHSLFVKCTGGKR